jgi:hypothetical protein
MRIALCGVRQNDTNEFISQLIKEWPMYEIVEVKPEINLNKDLTYPDNETLANKQYKLLNDRIDKAMEFNKTKNILHTYSTLDSLVSIFWNASKGNEEFDDLFIQRAIMLAKQSMTFYDVIFYLCLSNKQEGNTDTEFDNFYSVILETYTKNKPWIFPFNEPSGSPPMIEIFGNVQEKIQMMKLYINTDGQAYCAEDSLITNAFT